LARAKFRKSKEIDQRKLFEFGFSADSLQDGLKSLNRLIPASQTSVYTHGLHPYVAKFMPQYPNLFIKLFSKEKETVLDPMCGSGTTLIESLLNNRNAVGVDIDPLARLMTRVSTTKITNSTTKQLNEKWLPKILKQKKSIKPKDYELDLVPNHSLWFRDDILAGIFFVKDEVETIDSPQAKGIARIALSRIIKDVSNADPRDVMPEINHDEPVNLSADLFASFTKSLAFTLGRVSSFSDRMKTLNNNVIAKIVNNDARNIKLSNNEVDLIITSPPYAYAMDYARMHKLSIFTALGISDEVLRELSREYVGTDRVSVKEEPEYTPEIKYATPFIKKLKEKNLRRGISLHKYILDMNQITKECVRVLKKNHYFVYVIGDSTLGKSQFSTATALKKMCENYGMKLIKTHKRPYFARKMGSKRATYSAITKSDVFLVMKKIK
jgi:DNA modification methylase